MFLQDLCVFYMNVYVLQNILIRLTYLFYDSQLFILSSFSNKHQFSKINFGVYNLWTLVGLQTGIKPLLCVCCQVSFPPNQEDLHCPRSLRHRPGLRPLPRGWRGRCYVHCRDPNWWGTEKFKLEVVILFFLFDNKMAKESLTYVILHNLYRFQAWGGGSSVWKWPCSRQEEGKG